MSDLAHTLTLCLSSLYHNCTTCILSPFALYNGSVQQRPQPENHAPSMAKLLVLLCALSCRCGRVELLEIKVRGEPDKEMGNDPFELCSGEGHEEKS